MPSPANHETGIGRRLQRAGVAQNVEHRIGNAFRACLVEFRVAADFVTEIDNVAQNRKQVLLNASNHLSVNESACRCAGNL